ncbi:MAG: anthranilate synthase component I [Bacillota bacterium]
MEQNYYPSRAEFQRKVESEEGNLIPVYGEVIADLETPVSAFKKLDSDTHSYLLESVEGGQKVGRYSFIGIDPFLIFSYQEGRVKIEEDDEISEFNTDQPLTELQQILDRYQPIKTAGLPRFFGGAVGYLGYDLVTSFEEIPANNEGLDIPDALLMLTDRLLIFDHVQHKIKIVVNVVVDDEKESAYQRAVEKIDQIKAKLREPVTETDGCNLSTEDNNREEIDYTSNLTKEEFMSNVEQAKEYIRAGDIFQVVLSQRLQTATEATPFQVYRTLRRVNPSPYMYYLKFAELQLVGSSPEMLVRVEDNVVENRPIAGTRHRGSDQAEDERLAEEMLNDQKERAEHTMLVDLARNDVGRVSQYGSVEVDQFMEVEKYSHVMHLVSNVTGELHADQSEFDALRACFPAGTLSGSPKIRAMEIINQLEPTKRGPYGGAIGYFSFDGNLDSCITIRTMLFCEDQVYLQAGAGIVADSDPEAEYEETLNKAAALLEAIKLTS